MTKQILDKCNKQAESNYDPLQDMLASLKKKPGEVSLTIFK